MRAALRMLRSPVNATVAVVLLWAVAAFLLLPVATLLGTVFTDASGAPTLRALGRLAGSQRATDSLLNSFVLAVVLSITVNLVGVFLVLVTRYYRVRGSRLLWLGYASTLVCGGIVLVFGYQRVYGPTGLVTGLVQQVAPGFDTGWFSGVLAVVLVMTFASTGNHLLFLSAALARVDHQTVEAARMMGASEATILARVVLPVLRPTLFAVTILVFLGGLGALAAPQVLGGRDFQTIAPMVLAFAGTSTSRDLAATLALLLGLVTLVLLAVLNRLERRGVHFSVSKVAAPLQRQPLPGRTAAVLVHVAAYALLAVYALPPLLVVAYSFLPASAIASGDLGFGSLTLDSYVAVFTTERGLQPLLVSIGYGAAASGIVLVGMLFVARMLQHHRNALSTVLEHLLHIPWVLPSTLIALGLLLTFDEPRPAVLGAVLGGTPVLLGVAYVIAKTPFTFRLLKASFSGVPDHLEEAAAMLGAGPLRAFWRVVVPLVVPTAAAVTALNFTGLLDDYDAAVFLAHPLLQPLGIVIKNAASGESSSDGIALTYVYAVLLMLISTVAMWLVYGRSGRSRRTAASPSRRSQR